MFFVGFDVCEYEIVEVVLMVVEICDKLENLLVFVVVGIYG